MIGSGLISNDFDVFCGMESTSNEVSIIDAIFAKVNLKTELNTFVPEQKTYYCETDTKEEKETEVEEVDEIQDMIDSLS